MITKGIDTMRRRNFISNATNVVLGTVSMLQTGCFLLPSSTPPANNGGGGNGNNGGDWRTKYPHLSDYMNNMRWIPGGTFQMGSEPYWGPVHTVTVSSFKMGATPVPVAVWREYVAANNLKMPLPPRWGWIDDHPIIKFSRYEVISFNGSSGFIPWVFATTGVLVKLPTEAQWEYAARGGVYNQKYPWGNRMDTSQLWISDKLPQDTNGTGSVFRGLRIHQNAYGLTDMLGNVKQMCSDWVDDYPQTAQVDPAGPPTGHYKALRGVSWGSFYNPALEPPEYVTSRDSIMDVFFNDLSSDGIGLRLVI